MITTNKQLTNDITLNLNKQGRIAVITIEHASDILHCHLFDDATNIDGKRYVPSFLMFDKHSYFSIRPLAISGKYWDDDDIFDLQFLDLANLVDDTEEIDDGIVVDYDSQHKLVAFQIRSASERLLKKLK